MLEQRQAGSCLERRWGCLPLTAAPCAAPAWAPVAAEISWKTPNTELPLPNPKAGKAPGCLSHLVSAEQYGKLAWDASGQRQEPIRPSPYLLTMNNTQFLSFENAFLRCATVPSHG